MREEKFLDSFGDNAWQEFVRLLGASIITRLEEIENEVDWDKLLNLGDDEIKREAYQLKEDLARIKKLIKDL